VTALRLLLLSLLLACSAHAWAGYPGSVDLRDWSPDAEPMRITHGQWLLTWRDGARAPQRVTLPFTWH
jgi:hypothetical protein